MSQRNLLILLLAGVVSYTCYVRGEQNPYARHVASGLAAIEAGSLEEVPDRELFDGAMRGMVEVLRRHGDEHSQYLAAEDAEPLRTEIRQQFGGIGVRIRFAGDPPRLIVSGPPEPGTPADRAHLAANDRILAIDDRPTEGLDIDEVLALMRGDPGTVVRLTIQRPQQPPRSIELVREIISMESILGDERGDDGRWQFRLPADPRIAHLRITFFGDRTADEFDHVMEELIAGGIQAAVIDLRDNVGGALDAAVTICDRLLPAGRTIVETRGRDHVLRHRYETTGAGKYLDLPLAVVVNHNSASAAEIVAACLQDHGRAAVAGERTYGKGTVQQLVPLANRSLLKLTWASFWRPSGANIHRLANTPASAKWGVVPDRGLERPLSRNEYAEYRKYRIARDARPPAEPPPAEPPPAAGTDDEQDKVEPFVDVQLLMAVEHLQRTLDVANGGEP
jgi:carboxyl-terminal processing protease